VQDNDKHDAVTLAKKFYDLGMTIYATKGTADAIGQLGNDIVLVDNSTADDIFKYLETGCIQYIVNTCPNIRSFVEHHIKLHRRAQQLQIACLSSLDTAHALADILASGFNENNTELVDINAMRKEHISLNFSKMHCQGNDYICLDNFGGEITFPESVATIFCRRNNSIGADGLILINGSEKADAAIRMFNSDGSEVQMGGNCLRCVTKYLYDKGVVKKKNIVIDTASGIRNNFITLTKNEAGVIRGEIGKPEFTTALVPSTLDGDKIVNRPAVFGGKEYKITCLSLGNPHCVVFSKRVDDIDIEKEGVAIENAECFPERVNVEFVRVIDRHTLKMRVWERGNGETLSCGTGACAAAVAAIVNGFCDKNDTVCVKTRGGDMFVKYEDDMVYLSGTASLIYDGVIRI
jgi:carbamoyl-phosphate synthase large subunit